MWSILYTEAKDGAKLTMPCGDPATPRRVQRDKPFTLLEAKAASAEPRAQFGDEGDIKSIRNYAFESGVPHVILTNGKIWQAHVFASGVLADHYQLAPQVDIYNPSSELSDCAAALTDMFAKVLAAPRHRLPCGWVSLEGYLRPRRKYRGPYPSAIRFPDGEEYETNQIRDLVKCAADWLCKQGLLKPSECPIFRNRRKTELLVSVNGDGDLERLPAWEQVGNDGLFVRTGERGNANDIQVLLERCGGAPSSSDVYVRVRM